MTVINLAGLREERDGELFVPDSPATKPFDALPTPDTVMCIPGL